MALNISYGFAVTYGGDQIDETVRETFHTNEMLATTAHSETSTSNDASIIQPDRAQGDGVGGGGTSPTAFGLYCRNKDEDAAATQALFAACASQLGTEQVDLAC